MRVRAKKEDLRYVLKEDRSLDPQEQSVFLLRRLTLEERIRLAGQHKVTSRDGMEVKLQDVLRNEVHLVRAGLAGWENVRDESGEIIQFESKDGRATDETLAWLTDGQMKELANAIFVHANPSVSLAKKFALEFSFSTRDSQLDALSADNPEPNTSD